ncbi:hypothetical protein DAT561_p0006 (plasmid) [Melissococcus plutonius]|uniref:Uncharacterized protein n=1 Tax=Melissococcus plutonius TaxID=33970 RepID=A0A2Z5Y4Z5_9ENTE|nr:hypothetical protein DAT561_p0006 [Melissococcus plutonius]
MIKLYFLLLNKNHFFTIININKPIKKHIIIEIGTYHIFLMYSSSFSFLV